jgi:outer membrane lipoprotein-sorting protein
MRNENCLRPHAPHMLRHAAPESSPTDVRAHPPNDPPVNKTPRARVLTRMIAAVLSVVFSLALASSAQAQVAGAKTVATKLPAPDKIVADYLKAVGGKKRLQSIQDATYEWNVEGQQDARARTSFKAPASSRIDVILSNGETNDAANARTAWARTPDGTLSTLTDREAHAARLRAALDASRLVDYKKQDVLARTANVEQLGNEPAYVVEFSRRNGARLRYYFGASSKLLLRISDDARGQTTRFSDYRPTQNGALEPHHVETTARDGSTVKLTLREARYNSGLGDNLFEPPSDAALNVVELMREVGRNQKDDDERVSQYTYTRKQTEREINDKGEVKKETIKVYEVYPVANAGEVEKLVSEDGVALTPERAAKEEKRVAEEIEKLEHEKEKRKEKKERERAEAAKKGKAAEEVDPGLSTFLRVSEFVSPRRERFRERDAIVFDFRARPGYKTQSREESIVSKLAGVVWIDPADKQIMRLEARLVEGYKVAGGLVASLRPGSAMIFEQTRLGDGVWLPKFEQVNFAAKLFIFAGIRLDATREYSNYKRFATAGEEKLDAPKTPPPES